jgi:hypothetical protein
MAAPARQLDPVAAYKTVLGTILDRRPSGTRQRLATALGKNRSFISQISNPSYATPIPANHLDVIFEICHFSPEERRQFIDLYHLAHPRRPTLIHDAHHLKPHTFYLPDLGDASRNMKLQELVGDFVRQLAGLLEQQPKKGKRK